MGYTIVGADRASGWLHAQKEEKNWLGKVQTAEIYITVIPGDASADSHIQLTDNSYAEKDASELQQRCVRESFPEGPSPR
jgi:hypothetical protein